MHWHTAKAMSGNVFYGLAAPSVWKASGLLVRSTCRALPCHCAHAEGVHATRDEERSEAGHKGNDSSPASKMFRLGPKR